MSKRKSFWLPGDSEESEKRKLEHIRKMFDGTIDISPKPVEPSVWDKIKALSFDDWFLISMFIFWVVFMFLTNAGNPEPSERSVVFSELLRGWFG